MLKVSEGWMSKESGCIRNCAEEGCRAHLPSSSTLPPSMSNPPPPFKWLAARKEANGSLHPEHGTKPRVSRTPTSSTVSARAGAGWKNVIVETGPSPCEIQFDQSSSCHTSSAAHSASVNSTRSPSTPPSSRLVPSRSRMLRAVASAGCVSRLFFAQ